MSTGEGILLVALIILLAYLSTKESVATAERKAIREKLRDVEQQLDRIEDALRPVDARIDDLPVSPEMEDQRRFDGARSITVADVRKWASGETMRLMAKSYHYPDDLPVFEEFEYRHDRLDDTNQTRFGYDAYGFRRDPFGGDWAAYRFLAKEDQCTTWSCAGDIRR